MRKVFRSGWFLWPAGILAAVLVMIALPVVATETICRGNGGNTAAATAPPPLVTDDWQRKEATSYLSYPEWYIVHAYEDFAGVLETGDEYRFDYLRSIGGFWRSLCGINRIVDGTGDNSDAKVMLYTIGLSFTAELAIKGLYEETTGRLAAWLRGEERNAEDLYALEMANDYASFLHQIPWYRYPFMERVSGIWNVTPRAGDSFLRRWERRLSLSTEWSVKAAYARLIGFASAATLGPADLRIRSVVAGVDPALFADEPEVEIVERYEGEGLLVETPRYRAFTELLRKVAAAGGTMTEIGGNDDILVTVLLPDGASGEIAGAREIFSIGIQSKPGWRRAGLDVKVSELAGFIRRMPETGGEFEHAYDY